MKPGLPKHPRTVIAAFLETLNRSGTAYCVVGLLDGEALGMGRDIDLIVARRDLEGVCRTLFGFCARHGLAVAQSIRHEPSAFYFVVTWTDDERRHYQMIDISADYVRRGRRLLGAEEVVGERQWTAFPDPTGAGFYAAHPAVEFIYYLLKKVEKGVLEDRHGDYLSAVWSANPEGAAGQIRRFWPSRWAEPLTAAAAGGEWHDVREALPDLRRAMRARRPRWSPLAWLREISRVAIRIWRPTGLHVVILGPDGAGKSSVAKLAMAGAAPAFRRTRSIHFRPAIGLVAHDTGPVIDPHGQTPRGPVASSVKLIYLLLDYWLGWLVSIRPGLVRSTLVVFDRYYHDLLIDPRRYRHGGPRWPARCVGALIPKPDLWILLDTPAEVARARKPELPHDEIERQRQAYMKLAARLPNAAVIDASQSLERVSAAATTRIVDMMTARTARRWAKI